MFASENSPARSIRFGKEWGNGVMEYGVVGAMPQYSNTPVLQHSNLAVLSMQIIEHISEMQHWSEATRRDGRRIVFVPTMGFLHDAHLRLVRGGEARGGRIVVSVCVNPAQFSPTEDFAAYPRDFGRDRGLLEREHVDVVFHPSIPEIY